MPRALEKGDILVFVFGFGFRANLALYGSLDYTSQHKAALRQAM